ncbi:uncharacterized protein LOC127734656 [Mytilus californianus]|uniref:uncharacterized protein LOC127734656 n=1 Tax=Mytilus californianus TaxID=6549 RepID=UPI0022482921|nr:uncharacterized protein LOC127734656 [Mytilus californianus]
MDYIADELWLNMAGDPIVPLTFPIPALRDREGFYSGEVIIQTLERRSYSTTRLQHDVLSSTEDNEIINNLMSFEEIKGLIIRKFNEAHWISIPIINDQFIFIDPKVKAQRTLPSSDVCQLIRSHCFHPGAVYIVQKDTCQTGTDGIDEKIGSTDVEENYEEGIIQNEVTTDNTTEDIEEQTSDGNDNGTKDLTNSENTMVKRNYELRKKPPKKRRKSFWYEYDQKKIAKRLPCYSVEDNLRNTDEDDDPQNDEEDSIKDLSVSSEMKIDVKQLNKDSPDKQEVGDSEDEDEDIDEDFSMEFADFEKMRMLTYVNEIMHCENSNCDEADHERHHQFIGSPEMIVNRERRRLAFGCGVISQKIISALLKYLTDNLVYNHHEPFRFGGRRIRKLTHIELQNIFLEYKFFADHYVTFVLHKEAIIYFHQRKTGCPYELANQKCMDAEVDMYIEWKKKHRK